MGRARGSDATLQLAFEATYGTPPASGYTTLPFVSSALGATRGLIESDLLGQGRRPFDPTADVVVNDGDVVVPIDLAFFGFWLKMLFGNPVTSGSSPLYTHEFNSGEAALPSASIPIGHPKVPSYSVNYGVRANTLSVSQQRSGLLNATIGCIAKGETTPGPSTTIPAAEDVIGLTRFAQAAGEVSIDGDPIGSVVDGSFSYSNGLDKIETIQPDGEIEDVDAGMPAATGQVRLRFANHVLLNKAIGGDPVRLTHTWTGPGASYFAVEFPRVFLPRPKRTIDGPGGVMASFDWQGASQGSPLVVAALRCSVPSY